MITLLFFDEEEARRLAKEIEEISRKYGLDQEEDKEIEESQLIEKKTRKKAAN